MMMNLPGGIILSILASLILLTVPVTVKAQVPDSDAASLQRKAVQAQARILANKPDRDQLMIAIKTNEVPLAKQILLKNGFTAEDLENTKITLRAGGGKVGEHEIGISVTCCDPKEITIQRSLEYFTK